MGVAGIGERADHAAFVRLAGCEGGTVLACPGERRFPAFQGKPALLSALWQPRQLVFSRPIATAGLGGSAAEAWQLCARDGSLGGL